MKLKSMSLLILIFLSFGSTCLADNSEVLDGLYDMTMEINGKIFHDHLELRGKNRPINRLDFGGPIEGSIKVENAFTASLSGYGFCTTWIAKCNFNFEILANENGQTYKVKYKGGSSYFGPDHGRKHPAEIRGQAFLEDGSLLGKFTAIRRETKEE